MGKPAEPAKKDDKKESQEIPPPAKGKNFAKYQADAQALFQLYQKDCIDAVEKTKDKKLSTFFDENKGKLFQDTACGKFAQMLSSHAVGMRSVDDLYRWRGDMWRKTYDLYYNIGNRFARTKWFSYTNKYCYYNVLKDLDAYDDEVQRFNNVKADEKKADEKKPETPKSKRRLQKPDANKDDKAKKDDKAPADPAKKDDKAK